MLAHCVPSQVFCRSRGVFPFYRSTSTAWRTQRTAVASRSAMQSMTRSACRDAALHCAMDARFQERYIGLAVERPKRRFQKPGPKTGWADGVDRRAFGFVPGNTKTVYRNAPEDLQQTTRGRKRTVFRSVGCKRVEDQRQAYPQRCREKQWIAVQGEADVP